MTSFEMRKLDLIEIELRNGTAKQTDELPTRPGCQQAQMTRGSLAMNYQIPSDATPEERELITEAYREAAIAEREKQLAIEKLGGEAALKTADALTDAIRKVRNDRKLS
jgi:hypothetical protein